MLVCAKCGSSSIISYYDYSSREYVKKCLMDGTTKFIETESKEVIDTMAKHPPEPKQELKEIAKRITLVREKNGLTKKEFGQAVGRSIAVIVHAEQAKLISNDLLGLIAQKFNVPLDWLMHGGDNLYESVMKQRLCGRRNRCQ